MEYRFTNENFESEVMRSDVPVLIDFFAQWCGPCRMMGPVVEKLAEEYEGRIKVGKIDVDEEPELAMRFGVQSIPSLFILKDGKIVDAINGFIPKERLDMRLQAFA